MARHGGTYRMRATDPVVTLHRVGKDDPEAATMGSFWWAELTVNGHSVRAVFDTASHALLIADAEECDGCTADTAPARGGHSPSTRKETLTFGADKVRAARGTAQVCHLQTAAPPSSALSRGGGGARAPTTPRGMPPPGMGTCSTDRAKWIVWARKLGFSVWGVGPCASRSATDAPRAGVPTCPFHVLGFAMRGPPATSRRSSAAAATATAPGQGDGGARGKAWFKRDRVMLRHAHRMPLWLCPAVVGPRKYSLPFLKVSAVGVACGGRAERVWPVQSAPPEQGAGGQRASHDDAYALCMMDTGTPGTLIPVQWLPRAAAATISEFPPPGGTKARNVRIPEDVRVSLYCDASPAHRNRRAGVRSTSALSAQQRRVCIPVKAGYWTCATRMWKSYRCRAMLGSLSMETFAWELDYKRGEARVLPLEAALAHGKIRPGVASGV